jgi:hypothetical protein
MSAAERAFKEWYRAAWQGYADPAIVGFAFEGLDLAEAFAAGWEAAMYAEWVEWVTSDVPLLGIKGGDHLRWVHPGHPEGSADEPGEGAAKEPGQ